MSRVKRNCIEFLIIVSLLHWEKTVDGTDGYDTYISGDESQVGLGSTERTKAAYMLTSLWIHLALNWILLYNIQYNILYIYTGTTFADHSPTSARDYCHKLLGILFTVYTTQLNVNRVTLMPFSFSIYQGPHHQYNIQIMYNKITVDITLSSISWIHK